MSYPEAIKNYSGWNIERLDTIDVRPDSRAEIKEDFLFWKTDRKYSAAITNPPFNIALDVIQKSLSMVESGGLVIMLLRLNFFGGQKRSEWFKKNMPYRCYVHSKRMSFTKGATDSIEYMHAVWVAGTGLPFTELKIL